MRKYPTPIQIFTRNLENLNIYKHFLVPLIDLDLDELNVLNVSCYLNKKKDLLYLHLKAVPEFRDSLLRANDNFQFSVDLKGVTYYVYRIPSLMLSEVEKITNGKLLTLLDSTKTLICKHSGLYYNVKEGAFISSHVFLQALYKDSPIRKLLADYLEEDLERINTEVLGKLSDDSIIYIENFIKQ